ncbi:MAG: NTPase [Chloroflexi bacterium]|nr:NTPase [Chloroflexota bacterium]
MVKRVLLLTGAPGVGKTTVLTKVVDALKAKGVSVGGMVSHEVREGNVRVGFEILDLASGKHGWLAHVNQKSGPMVGKYHVNLGDIENIGTKAIVEATEKCDVVAIDEIGPMELYSEKFKQAVMEALESPKLVMAVVHAKAKDLLITLAKARDDAEIFIVNLGNRSQLPVELTEKLLAHSSIV